MEWREKFRSELDELHKKIRTMADLTVAQLRSGLDAIENADTVLAQKVFDGDGAIDILQREIEDLSAKLIAMEQPVAGDLREIVSAIKIVSNIERIGDHAKHLAKGAASLTDRGRGEFVPVIRKMAEKGVSMFERGIMAFLTQDAALAREVAAIDSEIDRLKNEQTDKIMAFMKERPENVEEGANLLFLNRFMERLGDHVTNLCEWVYFTKTGSHIDLN